METEIVIPQALDDDEESLGDLSSLLSPTTMWMQGNMTPVSAFPHKVSIHTGGVDLKTLLSQGGSDHNNNSNDYIFTDDESGSSPAASRIGDDDELLSPISSTSILGVEPPFLQEQEKQQNTLKEEMLFASTEEWSVHNQQRGREVAKHVLQKVRSKKYVRSPEIKTGNTNASPKSLYCTTKMDTNKDVGIERQSRNTMDDAQNAPTTAKNTKVSRRGILSRCMNRLRRQRRNFLDKIFHSNNGGKVSESPKSSASTENSEMVPRIIPSHGSTDSNDSCKSSNQMQENEEVIDFEDDNSDYADGESIYIEDDDQNGRSKTQIGNKIVDNQDDKQYDDSTPKRKNSSPDNSNQVSMGPKQLNKPDTPSDSSVATNFSMDDKKQIHRTSQVVDSILRQFVDDNAKSAPREGAAQHLQIKKPMTSLLLARRETASWNSKATGSQQPDSQMRGAQQTSLDSVSGAGVVFARIKATSRVRDLAEAAEEIRKLGKEGELYLAQMGLRLQEGHASDEGKVEAINSRSLAKEELDEGEEGKDTGPYLEGKSERTLPCDDKEKGKRKCERTVPCDDKEKGKEEEEQIVKANKEVKEDEDVKENQEVKEDEDEDVKENQEVKVKEDEDVKANKELEGKDGDEESNIIETVKDKEAKGGTGAIGVEKNKETEAVTNDVIDQEPPVQKVPGKGSTFDYKRFRLSLSVRKRKTPVSQL